MATPITTNTANHAYLASVYASTSPTESKRLYDEWAASYDADMASSAFDYLSPAICSRKVLENTSPGADKLDQSLAILDAGCGTGLVGLKLRELGAGVIDGVDLSTGMLDIARKAGVYRNLQEADLSVPMKQFQNNSYDVLICCGTLTHGHVGPKPALEEFCRVTKKGGLVVATVLGDIWESGGYKNEVERLEKEGVMGVVESGMEDYRRGAKVKAVVLVLRVK